MPSAVFSKTLIVSQGILMNNATAEDNVVGQRTLTNHSRKVFSDWNETAMRFFPSLPSLIFRESALSERKYLKL